MGLIDDWKLDAKEAADALQVRPNSQHDRAGGQHGMGTILRADLQVTATEGAGVRTSFHRTLYKVNAAVPQLLCKVRN